MIKVFYDGLGCIFTANDLRLLDDDYRLRDFLKENTTKQCDDFLLPENVEKRFNVIGNAVVEYLCFDDGSDKRMYLIWGNQSLSKIDIFNKAELKTFRANDSENALKLLLDDGNSKTEPKKDLVIHKTEMMTAINQASMKFWNNVDMNDKETHPTNNSIVEWLLLQKDCGFSQNTAKVAATIIRPLWAKKQHG